MTARVKVVTVSQVIPDVMIDYSLDRGAYYSLLGYMASNDIPKEKAINTRGSKVRIEDLWYMLELVRRVLGRKTLNTSVAIKHWDVGLVMVYTPPFDEAQIVKALVQLKKMLLQRGVDPTKSEYYEQIVELLKYELWQLSPLSAYNRKPPSWDAIHPKMRVSEL